jgi:hypothetical protein
VGKIPHCPGHLLAWTLVDDPGGALLNLLLGGNRTHRRSGLDVTSLSCFLGYLLAWTIVDDPGGAAGRKSDP